MSDYVGAAARIEGAVINMEPDEVRELYKKIGYIEFSAKALGLACRFRGIEMVKALCESGATFDIPQTDEAEEKYHVYSGSKKYDNYRSEFSLYLLNILKQIKGACCCKGLKFLKQIERDDKKKLKQISDSERAEVLKYLCENAEKLSFRPSELLLFSIYTRDDFIYDELKKLGVKLSKKRIDTMTVSGGALNSDMYWYEYSSLAAKMTDEDYLPVMEKLAAELDGKQFHCTEKIFEITKARFAYPKIAEFFFEKFEMDKLNKLNIMRSMIDGNSTAALALAEKAGWINSIKRRDELIDYAQKSKSVECTAWLLDYKNRTADLAAEQAKAEKKMNAELNANPNSVTMLKKIWSYKQREIGEGLVITSYKGTATEVTVPETIGKSTVVEIGNGAFAGSSGIGAGSVVTYASGEQQAARRKITKVVLPKSIKFIGRGAFADMLSLESIEIPDGVIEIEPFAFDMCNSLTEVIIPGSVRRIGMYAFAGCKNLRRVKICEGLVELGAGMFSRDINLKELELPKSLRRMLTEETRYNTFHAIDSSLPVTVICPRGSYAEQYCKEHGIKFKSI